MMMRPHDPPRLDLGLADLSDAYDLILCDVWGVVHDGLRHHATAVEALRRFRRGGGTVILVTNAPAPRDQVVRRLDRLAVPSDAYDDVASSGDVTIDAIVDAGCPALFNIGPRDELALYDGVAARGGRRPRLTGIDEAALAICIGLDETGDTPEAYDPVLERLRARHLGMICANPDLVVEVGSHLVYCAGAIAARYAAIGGTVIQAGKPYPAIYARAFALARAARGCDVPQDRTLAIGDALATDLKGARDQGVAALLITAGIHRDELHADGSTIDASKLRRALTLSDLRPVAALPTLRW